jgi:tRNA-splicing ligase RtcB
LPDPDLAYLPEGTEDFDGYVRAIDWAANYALASHNLMNAATLAALRPFAPAFDCDPVVYCRHNYAAKERHFGQDVFVTRKGACRARVGDTVIIPGAMGGKSFICKGKGERESFESCSHGAGRAMSRTEARKRFTAEDQASASAGLECRKDASLIDEIKYAYKDVDAVLAAERDLVEPIHELREVVNVKG